MIRTNVKSGRDIFKRIVVTAGFFALGKGMQSASHFDKDFIESMSEFPDGFTFQMVVKPAGPAVVLEKKKGKFIFKGLKPLESASLTVYVKTMDAAFMMIVTLLGAAQAFAEHRLIVVGDLPDGLRITKCMNIVQFYLFPKILSKNILRKVPKLTPARLIGRIRLYCVGVLFGI